MCSFLDERYYEAHKEYLRGLKLRYSVFEHEFPVIKNVNYQELRRVKLARQDRINVQSLALEILLHEAYFSSFTSNENTHSESVRELLCSEDNLKSQLYGMAMSSGVKFVGVVERSDKAQLFVVNDYSRFLDGQVIIAVDMCEHAYFGDYGFNKEKYIRYALKYINRSLFDRFF